jgi:hypothetical protein
MNTPVELYVHADLAIQKLRKDATAKTKQLLTALKDAKEAAVQEMLRAQQQAVCVNNSTWVILQDKPGAFTQITIETLTDTLLSMQQVDEQPAILDYVHNLFMLRGSGRASLTVQCHPPSNWSVENEPDNDCYIRASAYVDALSSMKVHIDGIRLATAPFTMTRKEHESAVIQYVAPNHATTEGTLSRSIQCTQTGAQLYIKVVRKRRKRPIPRSTFMQIVDTELRSRLNNVDNDLAHTVQSEGWITEFRTQLESSLTTYTDGGFTEMDTRISISKTPPRTSRSN